MNHDEAREVSRIARQRIRRDGFRIEGLPTFPHVFHTFMVVLTAGVWLPVYALCYQFSARRRFMNKRNNDMLREARSNITARKAVGCAY